MKKVTLLVSLLVLFTLTSGAQEQTMTDSNLCFEVNKLLQCTKTYFNSDFLLLSETLSEIDFLKQYHKKEFLSLAKDSLSFKQLLYYVDLKNDCNTTIWNKCCIVNTNLLQRKNFEESIIKIGIKKDKNVKRKFKFPIIAITKPYYFNNNINCLLGINYYSGSTSGSYGYYLFEIENGEWRIIKNIFLMVK